MPIQNLIEEHLFLAELIAFDYANIPGCQLDETRSEASMAIMRAAEAYDPSKGGFNSFASRAIRNALNTLYAKQLKLAKVFPKSLDEPIQKLSNCDHAHSSEVRCPSQSVETNLDIRKQVGLRETSSVIEPLMNLLTPRERVIVNTLKSGASYAEIGASLGISKQAAHKSAKSGLAKLRSGLDRLGYKGIATDGNLGSKDNNRKSAHLG